MQYDDFFRSFLRSAFFLILFRVFYFHSFSRHVCVYFGVFAVCIENTWSTDIRNNQPSNNK